MIYLDTSVALAELLAEDIKPPKHLWNNPLISSRLLEYETWNRINALGISERHGTAVQELLHRISFVEMIPGVLNRALDPFPKPVRTLDALHLATIAFLRQRQINVSLCSFDKRMIAAAQSIEIPLFDM